MPSKETALRLARRLASLGGGPEVRRLACARELRRLDPIEATELLSELIQLSRAGAREASCVLAASCAALEQSSELRLRSEELRRVARVTSLAAVEALFSRSGAAKEMDADAARRSDAQAFSLSLGHLKTRARLSRNPDELARLAALSDVAVLKHLLQNPRLTEVEIIRIAARRPTRPEPLIELTRSPRWGVRADVRRALVLNPYLPVDIGAKLVPLLSRVELREVTRSSELHAELRAQAQRLLETA